MRGYYQPLVVILLISSCSYKNDKANNVKDKIKNQTIQQVDSLYRPCLFSNSSFAYQIDSCNCDDVMVSYDTIFINLFQPTGGEIQNRFFKIGNPVCDTSYHLIMKFQNRRYVSSMGPDPLLTDWVLYTSPADTIPFDTKNQGFYVRVLTNEEQSRFPKFDTLDFYKAYKRAVGSNLNLDYVPDPAKGALYREFLETNVNNIVELSGVELHRIVLELHHKSFTEKVIVFNFGHMG